MQESFLGYYSNYQANLLLSRLTQEITDPLQTRIDVLNQTARVASTELNANFATFNTNVLTSINTLPTEIATALNPFPNISRVVRNIFNRAPAPQAPAQPGLQPQPQGLFPDAPQDTLTVVVSSSSFSGTESWSYERVDRRPHQRFAHSEDLGSGSGQEGLFAAIEAASQGF